MPMTNGAITIAPDKLALKLMARVINRAYAGVGGRLSERIVPILVVGENLFTVKARLPRGRFGVWVRSGPPIHARPLPASPASRQVACATSGKQSSSGLRTHRLRPSCMRYLTA